MTPKCLITHLRHVDLAIPDYERQLAFYTQVWGLTEVAGDTGIAFLAAEGSPERYIIRLRKDAASASTWSPSAPRPTRTWTPWPNG